MVLLLTPPRFATSLPHPREPCQDPCGLVFPHRWAWGKRFSPPERPKAFQGRQEGIVGRTGADALAETNGRDLGATDLSCPVWRSRMVV